MPDGCIFCGRGPLTAEHLIPGWVGRVMLANKPSPARPDSVIKAVSTIWQADAGPDDDVKMHEWMDETGPHFKTRCVCASCNNGWMSQIESASKTILTEMIEGRPVELGDDDAALIARWLALKGVIEHHSHPGSSEPMPWPAGQLYAEKEPPLHWQVRIGQYAGDHEAFFGGAQLHLTVEHPLVPFRTLDYPGFMFTVALGRFVGQVIGVQQGVGNIPLNARYFIPIWPRQPTYLDVAVGADFNAPQAWPPERAFDQAQLRQALRDPSEPKA